MTQVRGYTIGWHLQIYSWADRSSEFCLTFPRTDRQTDIHPKQQHTGMMWKESLEASISCSTAKRGNAYQQYKLCVLLRSWTGRSNRCQRDIKSPATFLVFLICADADESAFPMKTEASNHMNPLFTIRHCHVCACMQKSSRPVSNIWPAAKGGISGSCSRCQYVSTKISWIKPHESQLWMARENMPVSEIGSWNWTSVYLHWNPDTGG